MLKLEVGSQTIEGLKTMEERLRARLKLLRDMEDLLMRIDVLMKAESWRGIGVQPQLAETTD